MSDKEQEEQEEQEEQKQESKENKFFKYIENESKDVSYIWFNHFLNFVKPSDLAKKIFEIKDKKKNNDFVEEIKNRWSKLKDKIEDMSKDEKKNKGLDKILKIVKDILILNFNKQNQEGKGLKILTTNQLLKKVYIIIMETIFMNTEKSKTNE